MYFWDKSLSAVLQDKTHARIISQQLWNIVSLNCYVI